MITESIVTLMFILFFNLFNISNYYRSFSLGVVLDGITQQNNHEIIRIFTSNFYHLNLSHLLVNCISFINIGIPLQDYFNMFSKYHYPIILLMIIFFSSLFNFLIYYILYNYTKDVSYLITRSCGFSGVLFALQFFYHYLIKQDFFYACKVLIYNLILLSILVPNVSNIGHLSGLIAGVVVGRLIGLY